MTIKYNGTDYVGGGKWHFENGIEQVGGSDRTVNPIKLKSTKTGSKIITYRINGEKVATATINFTEMF